MDIKDYKVNLLWLWLAQDFNQSESFDYHGGHGKKGLIG